jgi:exodeoxyribonuclease V beta subunit
MSRETMTPEGPARLNPLTLPLRGSQLIEASAGTGKTFTIAMLYVRLVHTVARSPHPRYWW